jgi:putative ABC transport system permease protein
LLHAEAFAGERFTTSLLGVFSLGGLLMAAIGIYGVLAYYVSRRVREIGVRLALGARPTIILRSVLFHGLTLVVLGLGAGLIGSQVATRLVGSAIPELGTLNITAVTIASSILGLVAAVATYVPAQRAMRADPIEVLRAD